MKKVVIRVQMNCNNCRSKALKTAAVTTGISSVALQGEEKDEVVIIGDGIDAANLTKSLRKKVGHASIVSVQEVKETNQAKVEYANPIPITWTYPYNYQSQPHLHVFEPVYDWHNPSPKICSIM